MLSSSPAQVEFDYLQATNLIIVCCHAIYVGNGCLTREPRNEPYDESLWHLASFQKSKANKPGEHETFIAHITAALDSLARGSWAHNSIVVFSGGRTSKDRTLPSEALSYYHAAISMQHTKPIAGQWFRKRLLLEEHATDSYQNLIFSIAEFRKVTGRYPENIRIITHAFKARRFLDLHAKAVKWHPDRVHVQGIDPIMTAEDYRQTVAGENANGYSAWLGDPYGQHSPLSDKRKNRFWSASTLDQVCAGLEESVNELIYWEGGYTGQEIFYKNLPW